LPAVTPTGRLRAGGSQPRPGTGLRRGTRAGISGSLRVARRGPRLGAAVKEIAVGQAGGTLQVRGVPEGVQQVGTQHRVIVTPPGPWRGQQATRGLLRGSADHHGRDPACAFRPELESHCRLG